VNLFKLSKWSNIEKLKTKYYMKKIAQKNELKIKMQLQKNTKLISKNLNNY